MCMGKVQITLTYPNGKEGFAEAERKGLPDLCSERVDESSPGVWQRDVCNEGRRYAKTRKNRQDDDKIDMRRETE